MTHNDFLTITNPYNGSVVGQIPAMATAEVNDYIDRADAYKSRLTAFDRYRILSEFSRVLRQKRDEYAWLISTETGKVLQQSYAEVERACQTFLFAAEEAKRLEGRIMPLDAMEGFASRQGMIMPQPIGVVGAITPFNFPLNLVAHKVAPALAANNRVVLKPATAGSLTALKMHQDLLSLGLPDAMLQVITGVPEQVGETLVTHPKVRKLSFTGSVATGKKISQLACMQALTLELGGNDPLIVLGDADIEAAANAAVEGSFGNCGQRCTSVKRIIVENKVADELIDKMRIALQGWRVGDPMSPETHIGPLVSEAAAEQVEQRIDDALNRGARAIVAATREGAVISPCILDHVQPQWPLVKEETFGPVAPVIRVSGFEQAIEVANDSDYGLQAGVFTQNLDRAWQAVERIEAGAVMINQGPGFRAEHLPFGGVKNSGLGREGVREAVKAMTELKTAIFF